MCACVYACARVHTRTSLVREKISEHGGSADGKSTTCSHSISLQRVWGRGAARRAQPSKPSGTLDNDSDFPKRAPGRAKMLLRLSEKSPGAREEMSPPFPGGGRDVALSRRAVYQDSGL